MNDGTTHVLPAQFTGGSTDKSSSVDSNAADLHPTGNEKRAPVTNKVEVKDDIVVIKDKVIELKDMLLDRGRVTAEKIRRFGRAHPLKAIALAFAVGYIGMRATRPLRWL